MPECLSLQQFHRDEHSPLGLPDFVDRADVRVIQCGCGFGFPLEERQSLIFGYIIREELKGDKPTELQSSAL